MKIETPLVTMLLMSVLFIGTFTMFTTIGGDHYNTTMNETLFDTGNGTNINDIFDKINESKTEIEEVRSEFADTELTITNSLFVFLQLGFKTGKALLTSLTLFDNILFATADILGIDPLVIGALTAIIVIIFVVTIVMLLLGRSYAG